MGNHNTKHVRVRTAMVNTPGRQEARRPMAPPPAQAPQAVPANPVRGAFVEVKHGFAGIPLCTLQADCDGHGEFGSDTSTQFPSQLSDEMDARPAGGCAPHVVSSCVTWAGFAGRIAHGQMPEAFEAHFPHLTHKGVDGNDTEAILRSVIKSASTLRGITEQHEMWIYPENFEALAFAMASDMASIVRMHRVRPYLRLDCIATLSGAFDELAQNAKLLLKVPRERMSVDERIYLWGFAEILEGMRVELHKHPPIEPPPIVWEQDEALVIPMAAGVENVYMAAKNAHEIAHYAHRCHELIQMGVKLPPWTLQYLSMARAAMGSVYHYLGYPQPFAGGSHREMAWRNAREIEAAAKLVETQLFDRGEPVPGWVDDLLAKVRYWVASVGHFLSIEPPATGGFAGARACKRCKAHWTPPTNRERRYGNGYRLA